MNSNPTCIDGRNPRWGHYCHLFWAVFADILQKSGLTGTRFSREKNISVGFINEFNGQVELGITYVGYDSHKNLILPQMNTNKHRFSEVPHVESLVKDKPFIFQVPFSMIYKCQKFSII